MRKNSELIVITKAKDLISYLFTVTEKSPKKFRFTLVNRMINISLEILENLIFANEIMLGENEKDNALRYKHQKTVIAKLKILDSIVLIAREQKCILPNQYEILSRYIGDCINLTGAWINSDKKRMGIRL